MPKKSRASEKSQLAAVALASGAHPSERDLAFGVRLSVIAHLGLLVFILIKGLVFPGNPIPLVPTLRVDLVGLPDILKQDLSKLPKLPDSSDLAKELKQAEADAKQMKPKMAEPEPEPAKEVEKAAPDELVLKPKPAAPTADSQKTAKERERGEIKDRESKMKRALDRMKSLAKISAEGETAASPVVKGNRISKGTSLSGDAREAAESSYYDLLRDKFQENWALPVWIARQNLAAQVVIFIDSRGAVRNYKFTKPSGNPQFDEAVKRTLVASQPFPIPPTELQSQLLSNGILIGFPL